MASLLAGMKPRHQELIAAVVKNMGTAEIDWVAVAADANCNVKYARDEFGRARKALAAGGPAPSTPAKSKTPNKRKKDDDGEEDEPKTAKKSKTKKGDTGGKKGGKKSADRDDDEAAQGVKGEPESGDEV